MKIINSTDELLALRDKSGTIKIEGHLKITCDIPHSVGQDISGLDVGGYLEVGGYIYVGGNLYVGGQYLIVLGDLFWSHASKPNLPEKHYIKRVLPQAWQREYFQDRLGMDISNGCYDQICLSVGKKLVNLLKDDKWTSTEKWMIETLRDSGKELPGWVKEIKESKG